MSKVNREIIRSIKITDAWCKWDRVRPPSKGLRILAAELTGTIEQESEMTSEISKDMGEFLQNIAVN